MRKTRKEDLMEGECACGEVSCTSAECQAMAPAKVVSPAYYSGNKKKALGKKDKYNKLGEGVKNQIRSELNTLEMNTNLLIDTGRYYCPNDEDLEGIISAIQSSFAYLKDCCNSIVENVKGKSNSLKENGEVQNGALRGTDPEFWEFLQMTFNREEDPYSGSYDDLVEAVESFKKDWTVGELGKPSVLRYTANKWLATEGRSLCSEELLQREYNDYYGQ